MTLIFLAKITSALLPKHPCVQMPLTKVTRKRCQSLKRMCVTSSKHLAWTSMMIAYKAHRNGSRKCLYRKFFQGYTLIKNRKPQLLTINTNTAKCWWKKTSHCTRLVNITCCPSSDKPILPIFLMVLLWVCQK